MGMIHSIAARGGLAVLSGVLYALAYPPLGWGWLVVPGLAGLMLALRGQRGSRARAIGFLHGMTACAASLSWLFYIFGGVAVVLWTVLAAFTALFAHFQGRAESRGISGWAFVLFTMVNWCAWEFIRAELFPLKFPWMTAGLAMGPNALLPWIGVYGISLLVVLLAALWVIRKFIPAGCVAALLVAAVFLPSRQPAPKEGDSGSLTVAGLQLEGRSFDDFVNQTREMPAEIRHVVWPEYAVPFDVRANARDWKSLQDLCRERDITLTLGTQARPGGGDTWRNIALTLDPTGVLGEHTKMHPVHFFDDGIPGTTALPVPTSHGSVGTPICFDCDYEGVVRSMTATGAEYFLVPVMDAESWSARQHDQHAELFRIRACENGRWMLVCATSGVSQLIDPNGFVRARLPALAQGRISGILKRESQLTFHTRFGWLLPWLALGIAAICWIALLIPPTRVAKSAGSGEWKGCD